MNITAYDIAARYLGLSEVAGPVANPSILSMLRLDMGSGIVDDSTPWCSAFVNHITWLLHLPRSKSLAARSWLKVGLPVALVDAQRGFDVVVLSRGAGPQPDASVVNAPGHVGFYDHQSGDVVFLLAGNQGNAVTVEGFPITRVLGVRRLS